MKQKPALEDMNDIERKVYLAQRSNLEKSAIDALAENAALRAALAEITTAVREGDPQTIADVVGNYHGTWDDDPTAGELPY